MKKTIFAISLIAMGISAIAQTGTVDIVDRNRKVVLEQVPRERLGKAMEKLPEGVYYTQSWVDGTLKECRVIPEKVGNAKNKEIWIRSR